MKRLSDIQNRAISSRNDRLLVSAGAGSGKTSVLVERVLQRVLMDGVDIDRILIVTFTEAAAAEMKERIEKALYKAVRSTRASRAASQLHLLERAQISTLHSFCLRVLRLGALDLPVAPGFRIADGNEAALVFEQALADWLEEWLEGRDESRIDFSLRYGDARGDESLRKWLKQLYRYVQSQPEPAVFLEKMAAMYQENAFRPLAETVYADPYARRLGRRLGQAADLLREALAVCALPDGPSPYEPMLRSELGQVTYLQELALRHCFQELAGTEVGFARLPACKDGDEAKRERVKGLRDQVKAVLKKLYLRERTPAVLETQMRAALPDVQLLVALLKGLTNAYEAAKRARGIVDFQDLEQIAYGLLHHSSEYPAVSEELGSQFQEIMVDEYQDTSPLQDAILTALAGLGTPLVFLVGDVKQSIYRFRMADPGLFLEKMLAYRNAGNVIDMNENYRSRHEVVAAVNLLFGQLFTPSLGGIVYDENAQMVARAAYAGETLKTLAAPVELHLVESGGLAAETDVAEAEEEPVESVQPAEEDPQSFVSELEKIEREGVVIAQKIKALLASGAGVLDTREGGYRQVEFRDIAILLRSDQGRVEALTGVLRQAGIPSAASADSGFFSGYETLLALAFLQVVDNPLQDVPLISVLRSMIGEFTDEELANIRMAGDGPFFAALRKSAESADGTGLREKAAAFLRRLEAWRTAARTMLLPEAVEYLLRAGGVVRYFRVAPDGLLRSANLAYLERLATVFASVHGHRFGSFVHYLEDHLQNSDLDLGGAAVFSERDNVVRIMTIHKSKGLEFPVVFVAGLGNAFNLRHDSPIYLHRRFGFGFKFTDLALRERVPTVTSMALQEIADWESLAEEARVLYVAMTRARERLFLIASLNGSQSVLERTREQVALLQNGEGGLPEGLLLQARRFLDWILPGVLRMAATNSVFVVKTWDKVEDFQVQKSGRQELRPEIGRFVSLDPTLFASASRSEEDLREAQMQRVLANAADAQADAGTPFQAKISVSEWRKAQSDMVAGEDLAAVAPAAWRQQRPVFMQGKQDLTPAEQGSLFHRFMQHMALSDPPGPEEWYLAELERQVATGVFAPEEAGGVYWQGAMKFFNSLLGKRLWQARRTLKREVPFTMSIPARKLAEGAHADDTVVVQGVVDSLFEEDGEFVVVDYKTDRVSELDGDLELAKSYQVQLQLYADAVAKGYLKPVKEAWLFYVRSGRAIYVAGSSSVIRE